jgi:hypothetical protein
MPSGVRRNSFQGEEHSMTGDVRSTNDQTDDRPESSMESATPTAVEASRTALFGILLVIGALAVAGGVWWYVGMGGAAAEAEAARKIDSLGGFVHPLRDNLPVQTVDLSKSEAKPNLDAIVAELSALVNVKTFNARGAGLTDEHLETVGQLDSLTSLLLHFNDKITDAGVAHLTGLDNLVLLEVYGTQITDKGLESIGQLTNLTTLNIGKTKVTGDLSELLPLVNLQWLVAGDMELSDDIAATLGKLPKLTHLQIQGATISDEAVDAIRKAKPGMTIDLD